MAGKDGSLMGEDDDEKGIRWQMCVCKKRERNTCGWRRKGEEFSVSTWLVQIKLIFKNPIIN